LIPGFGGQPWRQVDGLPEYGWSIRLHMLAWIREQVRYPGIQPLLEQMDRDCARVADICARNNCLPTIPGFDHRAEPKEAFA
jgi:hypothetical protein